MSNGVKSWSYSALAQFQQCPQRFKFSRIDRRKEPPNPAMERGDRLHKACEAYLKNEIDAVPDEVLTIKKFLEKMALQQYQSEAPLAFNNVWREVAWFDREAWLRVKIDAYKVKGARAEMIDFKTGKIREEEHRDQFGLYATALLLAHSKVREVKTAAVYIDPPADSPKAVGVKIEYGTYKRGMLPDLLNLWADRAAPMFTSQTFPANPGWYCDWCPFSRHVGGPCDEAKAPRPAAKVAKR